MSLGANIIRIVTKRAASRFEPATRDPIRVQTEKLLGMMQKNAGTDYGKRYGFESVRTIEDYQRKVQSALRMDLDGDVHASGGLAPGGGRRRRDLGALQSR